MFKRLGLFHRIFLHGVLLIVALSIGVVISFHAANDSPQTWFEAFSRSATLMADAVLPRGQPQEGLRKKVEDLQFVTRTSVAVYTQDGVLLAHAGEVSVPPLSSGEVKALFDGAAPYQHVLGKLFARVPSPVEPSYLIILFRGHSEMLTRFVYGLTVALVIIAAMSFPLARSIAMPIRSITETARRLKSGDLDARVEIDSSGEIQVLAGALNDMASGLTERIRREKELLANVSHELRTPLTRIRVALEIAQESPGDETSTKRRLDEIQADVSELEQLVGDVLSAVRLDLTGRDALLALHMERTMLAESVKDAVERFLRHHTRPVAVEISQNCASASVDMDRALFLRVLDNLLDNADKYTPQHLEVSLAVTVKSGVYIVEVKDRGEGIAESDSARIFEPFYRCDKSRSKVIGGVGLGLTFCRRIVEAHGGTICASPREGGGTVVRIEIPADSNSIENA